MAITKPNIKAIQEVLLTDMQRRIFKQYNERKDEFNLRDEDYDNTQSALVDSILNLNDMRDVNELMLEYCDLFDSYDDLTVATIDGTMNYVIGLLVKQCELHKQSV
mgnify:FL=1|tara:strand:- start:47 stop:364 length:318 start_codon:yes stop_codon:yes gene_type:complete